MSSNEHMHNALCAYYSNLLSNLSGICEDAKREAARQDCCHNYNRFRKLNKLSSPLAGKLVGLLMVQILHLKNLSEIFNGWNVGDMMEKLYLCGVKRYQYHLRTTG
jgi:hypothetical protein